MWDVPIYCAVKPQNLSQMTAEVLLLSVALACLFVHIKAMSSKKKHQNLAFLDSRLLIWRF